MANELMSDPKVAKISYLGEGTFEFDGVLVTKSEIIKLVEQFQNRRPARPVHQTPLDGFGDCQVSMELLETLLSQSRKDEPFSLFVRKRVNEPLPAAAGVCSTYYQNKSIGDKELRRRVLAETYNSHCNDPRKPSFGAFFLNRNH